MDIDKLISALWQPIFAYHISKDVTAVEDAKKTIQRLAVEYAITQEPIEGWAKVLNPTRHRENCPRSTQSKLRTHGANERGSRSRQAAV